MHRWVCASNPLCVCACVSNVSCVCARVSNVTHLVHTHTHTTHLIYTHTHTTCTCSEYGVATYSGLLKITDVFCKRALWKRRYSAKKTYSLKEPTNRSHPTHVHVVTTPNVCVPHALAQAYAHTYLSNVCVPNVCVHVVCIKCVYQMYVCDKYVCMYVCIKCVCTYGHHHTLKSSQNRVNRATSKASRLFLMK